MSDNSNVVICLAEGNTGAHIQRDNQDDSHQFFLPFRGFCSRKGVSDTSLNLLYCNKTLMFPLLITPNCLFRLFPRRFFLERLTSLMLLSATSPTIPFQISLLAHLLTMPFSSLSRFSCSMILSQHWLYMNTNISPSL